LAVDNSQGSEEKAEFNESDKNIDRAEDGDPGAKEIIQNKRAKQGYVVEQQVTVPQFGPGNNNQEQTNFKAEQNEGNREQFAHGQPLASLFDI
jgi:hypothetical protein